MAEVWWKSKDDEGGRESISTLSCDKLVCDNPHQVLMNIKGHQSYLLHACSKRLCNFFAVYYRFFCLYSSCFIMFRLLLLHLIVGIYFNLLCHLLVLN